MKYSGTVSAHTNNAMHTESESRNISVENSFLFAITEAAAENPSAAPNGIRNSKNANQTPLYNTTETPRRVIIVTGKNPSNVKPKINTEIVIPIINPNFGIT